MAMANKKRIIYLLITLLVYLIDPCNSGRKCAHGEYGEDCAFVPAPPGRTPACAAPGYTYCENLDHYPNDLIRLLVDKGEYDLSTLLSDETRDDFSATRPSQGPYAYGPHSLSGIQGISLVTEKPSYVSKQPLLPQQPIIPSQPQGQEHHGQEQYHPNVQYTGNGQYHGQGGYQGQQFFVQNKGNTLPPTSGPTGYYPPSRHQQRPQPQPYLPSHDSYLPPKVSNISLSDKGVDIYQGTLRSGIHLDQYSTDFWRGNSYFETPSKTTPSYSINQNFHRNTFGPHSEYYDNNGPSPYYSAPPRDPASTHYKTPIPGGHGQAGWSADSGKQQQQYTISEFVPPPVTPYDPNDWWKRTTAPEHHSNTPKTKTFDSNELKKHNISKRSNIRVPDNKKYPFLDSITLSSRNKRQSSPNSGDQLCLTRSQYIMPRAALNKQGNWMYVVNMGETMDSSYSQLVKSEICVSQQCDGICSLPLGYVSRCEQRYVQKRLVALDQGGQRLYTDIFWFPSCCLCTISNNQT